MLKELYLEFEDGRKERNIIYLNPGEQVKIYPQRDKIVVSNCKPFKYKVEKHPYLCVAIANFGGEYKIMPAGVSCIPGTSINNARPGKNVWTNCVNEIRLSTNDNLGNKCFKSWVQPGCIQRL